MKIKEDIGMQVVTHVILGLFSLACLMPFILLIITSTQQRDIDSGKRLFIYPK